MPARGQRYRVVQWATGNIGTRALRAVLEHPELDLVGLYVYAADKEGRDAGELCGADPIGVAATRDIDAIITLRADCVLYMGDRPDVATLCRLLESGSNVVATRSEFHHPASMDPEDRRRLEEACRRGGSSLHATGSSPGFITEVLPLALLSIQRGLDRVEIDEFADMSSRNSPEMIFRLMGFGRDPARFDPAGLAHHARNSFSGSLRVLADAIGLPLDDVVASASVAVATRAVDVAAGPIEAGTVAGQRTEITGSHQGRPLLCFRSNWYLTTDLDPEWDLRETGWRVQVCGDAPLDVEIRFPVAAEAWAATSPGLTAHRPVNAIPYVCAAEPGIRTTAELPTVIPRLNRL